MAKKRLRNPILPHSKDKTGVWGIHPEFPWYKVSIFGEVRRVYKSGEMVIKPKERGYSYMLTRPDGERVKISAATIVWETFNGPYDKKKYRLYRRNNIGSDNSLINLRLATSSEIARKKSTLGQTLCVLKYDPENREFIERYKSIKEAAKANHYSDTAIGYGIRSSLR